ncbi:MAG: PglL family O-oligosaccharyltransferase [Ramlibacter sp.]
MLVAIAVTVIAYAALDRGKKGWLGVPILVFLWGLWATLEQMVAPMAALGLLAGVGMVVMWASIGSASDSHIEAVFSLTLLAVAVVSAVIAICQYFGVSHHLEPWLSSAPAGEAYGNLRQRNQLASLTSMGFAVVLHRSNLRRLVVWPALILLLAANAATASRIGLAELVLVGVAGAIWRTAYGRPRTWLLLASAAIYIAAAYALPALLENVHGIKASNVMDRLVSTSDCASRRVLWSNVAHLIGMKPWLGWGWGNLDYAHYVTLYPGARFCDILDNAHNLPMHLAVELGVPTAVICVAAVLRFVIRRAPWCEQAPARQLAWLLLLAIGAHSMVEYPLWYGPFQMTLGFCIGLLWRLPSDGLGREARDVFTRPKDHWRRAVAACVSLAVFYVAWDYQRVSQAYLPREQRSPFYRDGVLAKINGSWIFRDQVEFAVITTTPLSIDNAASMADAARRLLHFSPEPRVIEVLIESLWLLDLDDEALGHMARFKAAFPDAFGRWGSARMGLSHEMEAPSSR